MITPLVSGCLHLLILLSVACIGRWHGDSIWSVFPNHSKEECRRHESGLFTRGHMHRLGTLRYGADPARNTHSLDVKPNSAIWYDKVGLNL